MKGRFLGIKVGKSVFAATQLDFLGYVISKHGIEADQKIYNVFLKYVSRSQKTISHHSEYCTFTIGSLCMGSQI